MTGRSAWTVRTLLTFATLFLGCKTTDLAGAAKNAHDFRAEPTLTTEIIGRGLLPAIGTLAALDAISG